MGLFVRKVRTASGATTVQIARTSRGVQTIIEHLGSAHDEAQLAALIVIARGRIASKSRGVRTIVEHIGSAHDDAQLAALIAIGRERIDELTG